MTYQFEIPSRLSGLNEYTLKCRGNRYAGAELKHRNEQICIAAIMEQVPKITVLFPVKLHFEWHEKTKRRDLDNIAFAKKFVQDALVQTGVLEGDSYKFVKGFTDEFIYDGTDRVIVTIEEIV